MKSKFYIIIAVSVLMFSFQNPKNQKSEKLKSAETVVKSTEYKTKSGKKFIVHSDNYKGASICDVQIETSGFEAVNSTHIVGEIDAVEEVFLADLDKNVFEEIYLLTRSAGSGSYGNIYGMASNRDKSATPIYVPEILQKQMEKEVCLKDLWDIINSL